MLIVEYVRIWMFLLCVVQGVTVLQFLWLEPCRHSNTQFGAVEADLTLVEGIVDLSQQRAITASGLRQSGR
jgi:hypothetical protein